MDDETIIKGEYCNYTSGMDGEYAYHFLPKNPRHKVGFADVMNELFIMGWEGSLYVQFYRVPCGLAPVDADNDVVLEEPEKAIKMLAGWLGYTVLDEKGEKLE